MKISDIGGEEYLDAILKTKWVNDKLEPLFRGTGILYANNTDAMKITVGNDFRKSSMDSATTSHDTANKLSKVKLGVNIRNGLFATFDYDVAEEYTHYTGESGSKVVFVIPADNSKLYTSSTVDDFYTDVDQVAKRKFKTVNNAYSSPDEFLIKQLIPEYVDSLIEVTPSNARKFYDTEKEIIIFGDVYLVSYAFARKHLPHFLDM